MKTISCLGINGSSEIHPISWEMGPPNQTEPYPNRNGTAPKGRKPGIRQNARSMDHNIWMEPFWNLFLFFPRCIPGYIGILPQDIDGTLTNICRVNFNDGNSLRKKSGKEKMVHHPQKSVLYCITKKWYITKNGKIQSSKHQNLLCFAGLSS